MSNELKRIIEQKEFEKNVKLYTNTGNPKLLYDYSNQKLENSYGSCVLENFYNQIEKDKPLILDLGSGLGESADMLENFGGKTVRIDISKIGLSSQFNLCAKRVQANAIHIPLQTHLFDGIHCKDLCAHIHQELRDDFFGEIFRVLKPKGKLLLVSAFRGFKTGFEHSMIESDLVYVARRNGLFLLTQRSWTPEDHKNDWYNRSEISMKRFVLLFQKS